MMMKTRTYSELCEFITFEERFDYLKLRKIVGGITFGFERWLNQNFYKSREWKDIKSYVIVRDDGCDLGVPGYEIYSDLIVHHMNPITINNIKNGEYSMIDPEFLITTSHRTHNAIHYGDKNSLPRGPDERKRGDTTLW